MWLYNKKAKVWRLRTKIQNIKKGEQNKVKQMLNETLFRYPCSNKPHITFWYFTIIYIHTPSLGHDTSLIKSTQIKVCLLSFEGFNLEENFDLLKSLF